MRPFLEVTVYSMLREAVEQAFGASLFPPGEHVGGAPVEECEAIVRAIYAAGSR